MFEHQVRPRSTGLRDAARELRRAGASYKRIASEVGISPSTAFAWTRDIEPTPAQIAENLSRRRPADRAAIERRAAEWTQRSRLRRQTFQEQGRHYARTVDDPLHRSGCMLYWAEGRKDRNCVRISNSDVAMLAYFRRFLTECFEVSLDRLAFSLHVYLDNGRSLREIEDHWLRALELPRSCLRKHQVNPLPRSSSGAKRNRLPLGVGNLAYCSTEIVQHIYGAIQEYAGFEEPRWLD